MRAIELKPSSLANSMSLTAADKVFAGPAFVRRSRGRPGQTDSSTGPSLELVGRMEQIGRARPRPPKPSVRFDTGQRIVCSAVECADDGGMGRETN